MADDRIADGAAPLVGAEVGVVPLLLHRLTAAAGMVAAVQLALDHGLVAALSEGSSSLDSLGVRTGLTATTCGVLVRQLQLAGVVRRDANGGVELVVGIDGVRWALRRWDGLAQVADGAPARPTAHLYAAVTPMLAARNEEACRAAAAVLGRDGMHLLDLGGGVSGVGRHIAGSHRDVSVTVVDRPDVLAVLEGMLGELAPSFQLLAADVLRDPLPEDADVTLLSGVLHLFGEADVVRLLRRAVRATRDGGQVAITEPLLREDGEVDPAVTAYEVDLHLRQPRGGIWPYSRLAEWCVRAGLRDMVRHDLPEMMSLVVGRVDLRTADAGPVT